MTWDKYIESLALPERVSDPDLITKAVHSAWSRGHSDRLRILTLESEVTISTTDKEVYHGH
jgi:hypothetical protein